MVRMVPRIGLREPSTGEDPQKRCSMGPRNLGVATVNETKVIDESHLAGYARDGFFVLPKVVGDGDLAMLREECAAAEAVVTRAMDEQGTDVIGLNHRGRRLIVPLQYKVSERLPGFLFGALMAEVCRKTLGDEAYLFLEQFVVKGERTGMKLGWHQDSGYLPFDPPAYVTAWIALDDVDEENGTVYMLPYDRAGTRQRVDHALEAESNDKIGYGGDDPGVPVVGPAGTVAVFSSTCFHRSGGNNSATPRRAYIAQYSIAPIVMPETGALRHFADPFLQDGAVVAETDPAVLKAEPAMPWTWD